MLSPRAFTESIFMRLLTKTVFECGRVSRVLKVREAPWAL
jgi:hypothetical protein